MEILAHRYLLEGKDKNTENTESQLRDALQSFHFFETDIRRFPNGEFYISHDPLSQEVVGHTAHAHTSLWRSHKNVRIALNIKELGYERELLDFLQAEKVLDQVFLFDFELLGANPAEYISLVKSIDSSVQVAVRVSDHEEPVKRALSFTNAPIVWLDEFDSFWASEADIKNLHSGGKKVFCIAPDLHNFEMDKTIQRFQDFIAWGVDGICTDYPLLLQKILQQ